MSFRWAVQISFAFCLGVKIMFYFSKHIVRIDGWDKSAKVNLRNLKVFLLVQQFNSQNNWLSDPYQKWVSEDFVALQEIYAYKFLKYRKWVCCLPGSAVKLYSCLSLCKCASPLDKICVEMQLMENSSKHKVIWNSFDKKSFAFNGN